MGELIRSYDWSHTNLGPITEWPQCLRSSVNLVLHSPVPMVMLWGKDGIMIYNDAYSVIAGGRHPSLLGSKILAGWPETQEFNRNVLKVGLSGKTLSFKDQVFLLNRNGKPEQVWMDLNYSPLFDGSSKPVGVLSVVVETTERVLAEQKQKQTEKSLEDEKEQFQMMADNIPNLAWMADATGWIYWYNLRWYQYTGTTPKDMEGWGWQSVHDPEVLPRVLKTWKLSIKNGKPFEMVFPILGADGVFRQFLTRVQPVKAAAGKITHWFGTNTDVTEQLKTKQRLTDTEERFKTLIEKSTDAIQLVDIEGNILYSSESIKNVLGYTPQEFKDKGIAPFLHPEDSKYFYTKFAEIIANPKKPILMQYRVKHNNGTWAWIETTGVNHLKTPTIQALVGTFRNITDRKISEDALQQQLRLTKTITDTATACLFMIDNNGLVTFMNPAAQNVTGYTQKDVIGKPMHLLVHHSRPDGTPYPEHECPLVNTYKHGMPSLLHEDVFFKKNGTPFDALITGTPIPGTDGIQGTVVEFRDITKEKQAQNELRELIAITEQRNALLKINKTKDEFIGMASHQLRTPATAVKQYIGLLLDDFAGPLSPAQTQFLKVAYDSNERELNIINDLLKTAQISADKYRLHIQAQDISDLIEECISDLNVTFEMKQQKVIFQRPAAEIKIMFDSTEMKLVITNLLENASKYSYYNTEIKVAIKPTRKQIEIRITDNGVGVDSKNHQRIFDKFTRVDNDLSDTVTGTGLGLFWVKQIVELHKGAIAIESTLGKGSTFVVKLPR